MTLNGKQQNVQNSTADSASTLDFEVQRYGEKDLNG
jgi:hypothetical protein